MKTEEMESNVTRLAELIGDGTTSPAGLSDDRAAEAIGLAVGLVGSLVINVGRIADALERANVIAEAACPVTVPKG